MNVGVVCGSDKWTDVDAVERALAGAGDDPGVDMVVMPASLSGFPAIPAEIARKHDLIPVCYEQDDASELAAAMVRRATIERDFGLHVRGFAFLVNGDEDGREIARQLQAEGIEVIVSEVELG